MLERLHGIARILRPRALARTAKSVEDLLAESQETRRALKAVSTTGVQLAERTEQLEAAVKALSKQVENARVREAQLRAIYQRDVEMEPHLERLPALLDADAIGAHVARALAGARICDEPFPYAVVNDVLPADFYEALIRGLPPVEVFADRPVNKQRLVVPFEIAPAYSRRVWGFLVRDVLDRMVADLLVRKFREPLDGWLQRDWPAGGDSPSARLRFQTTDGRILLRTRGYHIPPHRDPKWGFITCLLYLAREGDSERWGTQLFSVDDDLEAPTISPHWISAAGCRLRADIPFRRNSMLVFLNSHGAHGATIPPDAEPEGLERYVYQFRIGPSPDTIRALMRDLPADRREFWAGKVADAAY
jgi:HPt (histidine-containing phosphotransfer) domain-containing protein